MTAFIGRAERTLVEVCHHDLPVRIEAGDHDKYDLIQDAQDVFIVLRGQIIRQQRCHLCAADFSCMQAHTLYADSLALLHQTVDLLLLEASRIGERQACLPDFL